MPASVDALVVAIDGPSGSGKSSVARKVAAAFGLRYLDTGSTYRAMTLWMLQHDVDVHDAEAVAIASGKPVITVGTDPASPAIALDGADVSRPIRGPEVTGAVSPISAVPAVRERLVRLQRDVIGAGGIVVEGRDIGTAVAPHAPVKVFLTASPDARAQRRGAELAAAHSSRVDHERVRESLAARDRIDSSRAVAPLTPAPDAVHVDATELSLEDVVDTVSDLVTAALHLQSLPRRR